MKILLLTLFRCFAHVVNLTAKAILSSPALLPDGGGDHPVKKLHEAIAHVSLPFYLFLFKLILYKIRSSQLRCDHFSKNLKESGIWPLQLIRDVETRWSSVYLMITRALALRPVSSKYHLIGLKLSLS